MEDLLQRAANDLVSSKYAVALTGAGMSTESGIPDFRGKDGIWTRDPEAERRAYEAYDKFLRDPKAHWQEVLSPESLSGFFAHFERAEPNPGHRALDELEKLGILKCILTQNVDGLHEKAGSRSVIEYHGSLLKLRCVSCGARFGRDEYDLEKLKAEDRLPPRCSKCNGVLKSDGVFFREPIPQDVYHRSLEEAWKCDLMLICGTSAVVYPFAELPRVARQRRDEKERKAELGLYVVEEKPATVIIEVNAEPTPLTSEGVSDYLIQGTIGEVLPNMVQKVKEKL
jgi:NAD-dependent deacetylase